MKENPSERAIYFRHPFLTQQIIAYIGNKRRLLPLIYRALCGCNFRNFEGVSFLDLFSGSGVVSRFAKYLRCRVYSNDWEPYSFIINSSYLGVDAEELQGMYEEFGGIDEALRHLNTLQDPPFGQQYIARFYSPSTRHTGYQDFRTERMFYTRENGLIIDRIRNEIERLYPPSEVAASEKRKKEKYLLVALLLYESATHTNTSGVFKAYHKGFGGHGRDALSRILAPIVLSRPVLIDSGAGASIYMEDAEKLVSEGVLKGRCFDVAYLDPPYNQHQYGSNYHILNTVGLWDRPPVNNTLDNRGVLKEKAGIRKDWAYTRSEYCYRDRAAVAFSNLMDALRARFILISYSTDGVIPFNELKRICAQKGSLEIVSEQYTKYRGGKQSIHRLNSNIEFVMIVDTKKKSTPQMIEEVDWMITRRKLALLFGKTYVLEKLKKNFIVDENRCMIRAPHSEKEIQTKFLFELVSRDVCERMEVDETVDLIDRLEKSACANKEEELYEVYARIGAARTGNEYFMKKIPAVLKKCAHKKYRDVFQFWIEKVKGIESWSPDLFGVIRKQIEELEVLAEKRFTL
jgi:adenine-specific DNA-methyltransferase